MAFDTRDLTVKIKGDTSDFEKSINSAAKSSEGAGLSFGKLTAAVAAGEAVFNIAKVGVQKLTGFLGDTIKSANDSENALAQLTSVLKSTGNAAGLSADDLKNQANALQKLTTFSDEAVMSAQNLLLTFTNVKGSVFKESIPIILDMSQALGQDLKSSSIQLGKALNDPIKGITALSRVGVSFTQQQKDQIEALVGANKSMEAQKIILKELKTEFGGSAEAAGKTFAGSLERLKNQVDDVKESIGTALVKALTPFTQQAANFVASVDWDVVIKRSTDAIRNIISQLDRFRDAVVRVITPIANYLQPKLTALWHTIEEKLVPTLYRLWKEVIEPLLPVLGVLLVVAIRAVIDGLNLLLTVLTPITNWMLDNKPLVVGLAVAFGILATAMGYGPIAAAFSSAMALVQGSIAATQGVVGGLNAALTGFTGFGVLAVAAAASAYEVVRAFQSIKQAWNDVDNASRAAAGLAPTEQMRQLQQQATAARAAGDYKKAEVIANALKALGGNGRASGGPVTGGQAYLVGEQGPEIFKPDQSGTIIPNDKLGSGGGVNLTVNVGMYAGMPVEKREIALSIYKEIVRAARAQGVSMPMIGAVGVQ